ASLATIVKNRNRVMVSSHQAKEKFFEQVTLANPQQQDALKRLEGNYCVVRMEHKIFLNIQIR
ncbi:MAG: hypothetical protein AAF310_05645, partial [Myxococcota bacterium]